MEEQTDSGSVRSVATWLGYANRCLIIGMSAVCAGLGLLAAAIGGRLNQLGSGPGGLGGVPLLLLLASALLGLPALLVALGDRLRGRPVSWTALLLVVGPVFIAVYFFEVPHAIDPCARGVFQPASMVNGVPLCGRWGGGWEIHARFHLLLHAVPTLLPVAAYWKLTTRFRPRWTRDGVQSADRLSASSGSAR